MPHYQVNQKAIAHARKLIDAGTVDADTEWSDAAPSADDGDDDAIEKAFDELLQPGRETVVDAPSVAPDA
jgi:hypothetical protein